MAAPPVPKLFQPIRVGTTNLQHRVVLAPMTRCRADAQHVPGALILEYYKQRTSVPGTLAITEATFIDACAGGYTNIPGIWNDEQVAGWKPVRPCPSCLFFLLSFIVVVILPLLFVQIGNPPYIKTLHVCALFCCRSWTPCTKTDRSYTSSCGRSDALHSRTSYRKKAAIRSSHPAQSRFRREPTTIALRHLRRLRAR